MALAFVGVLSGASANRLGLNNLLRFLWLPFPYAIVGAIIFWILGLIAARRLQAKPPLAITILMTLSLILGLFVSFIFIIASGLQ
jgi:FtsH-binding integral membrane protein